MLIATKQLLRCTLEGADDVVGDVDDLLFDGRNWVVRYLEINVGRWLTGRRVVLSPRVVQLADYTSCRLRTQLSREDVEQGPPLDANRPVEFQKEVDLARHYAWGSEWADVMEGADEAKGATDPNLRSAAAVAGYSIQAMDGEIGHVEDFLVDDAADQGGQWGIRYLVINTRNWLPGRSVVIPPLWAEAIEWEQQRVQIGLTKDVIQNSPPYDPESPVNRQYEEVFYDYYGRPKYWIETSHTTQ